MIFYAPTPMDLLANLDNRNIITIQLPSGGFIKAEAVEYDRIRIVDLVSTDPMDYMNANWQPGNLITLKPNI